MIVAKQKFFDSIAADWHENHRFNLGDEDRIKRIFSGVKFSEQDSILDLGGGTGRLSEFLARAYKLPLNFFITDISKEMLKEGKRCLNSLKFSWIQTDSIYLPFKKESFEHIFCFSAFPHFEDKEKVIEEAYRLLKKDGNFLIFHLRSRQDINQFHSQKYFPISKDFLPPKEEFQSWAKKIKFPTKTIEDGKEHFVVHFVKR